MVSEKDVLYLTRDLIGHKPYTITQALLTSSLNSVF